MQLKIKVTKDILRQAMRCGVGKSSKPVNESCALALAIRELCPTARVKMEKVVWNTVNGIPIETPISLEMRKFIRDFDTLTCAPTKRLLLPEQEFTIDFPDELVEKIGIGEVDRVLRQSKTLERV